MFQKGSGCDSVEYLQKLVIITEASKSEAIIHDFFID
jgi:hypothetical protein